MGDLGKIIVATSFEWMPKVQKIAKSGHTACELHREMEERALFEKSMGQLISLAHFIISTLY